MKKVLMVCLGNICRSPIAEAVFNYVLEKKGLTSQWEVDSAAIGSWHIGCSPDYRALDVMRMKGLNYTNRARQISKKDFEEFDYIFGMDEENIADLNRLKPKENHKAKILLLGDFGLDKSDRIIRDPYYDDDDEGFKKCYDQCVIACEAFLKEAQD